VKKLLTVSTIILLAMVLFAQSEFMIPLSTADFALKGPVKSMKTVYPPSDVDLGEDIVMPAYEVISFDEAGKIVSQISYDKDGKEINAILYGYDAFGKLSAISGRENGVEQIIGELTIEDGKIVSIVADEGEDKSTITMEYDENGRLVAQIITGMSEGQEMQIAVNMAYDERGNLIEESMSMMGMVLSKSVFEFDSNNLKIRELEYMYMFAEPGTEPEPIASQFEYNEKGDVSKKISDSFFSDDKEVTVYEYEYDAAGNYTHMTVYFLYSIQDLEKENWKELATVESEETREIEYY